MIFQSSSHSLAAVARETGARSRSFAAALTRFFVPEEICLCNGGGIYFVRSEMVFSSFSNACARYSCGMCLSTPLNFVFRSVLFGLVEYVCPVGVVCLKLCFDRSSDLTRGGNHLHVSPRNVSYLEQRSIGEDNSRNKWHGLFVENFKLPRILVLENENMVTGVYRSSRRHNRNPAKQTDERKAEGCSNEST